MQAYLCQEIQCVVVDTLLLSQNNLITCEVYFTKIPRKSQDLDRIVKLIIMI